MKIAVLHDVLPPDASLDLEDNLVQAREVQGALQGLGHDAGLVGFGPDLDEVTAQLKRLHPEVVFNLVEAPLGKGNMIHLAPLLLERMGLPFTGAGVRAMLYTSNKIMAKKSMTKAGLPTPEWLAKPMPDQGVEPGPWLVKSVWEHGSIGIEGDGLIHTGDPAVLGALLEDRAGSLGGEWFAERYVEGREFNLSILEGSQGPRVLPPAEILFSAFGQGRPRLVGYRAKWDAGSFEYHNTPRSFDLPDRDQPLLATLRKLALECWRLFRPKGWARVDFRVDPDGAPWILEVNANPCLSPDAGFMAAAQEAGLEFSAVVAAILARANHPAGPPVRPPDSRN